MHPHGALRLSRGGREECHAQMRGTGIYGRCTPPPQNGFFWEFESTVLVFTSLPLSLERSPSRHTGKSGEQPHGAVAGVGDPRERHAFLRVHPLGTEGVLGSRTRCGGGLLP